MTEAPQNTFLEYVGMLQTASWRFRYIEEALKMYIGNCYQIISNRLSSRLPFHYTYKDVHDRPLGQLIRVFKKLNSNKDLIAQLETLVKDRNHCAHQGYLMTSEEMHDPQYLSRELSRVKAIAEEADRAVQALLAELKAIELLKGEWL